MHHLTEHGVRFYTTACHLLAIRLWRAVQVETEYFVEEMKIGNLTIELSIQTGQGLKVIITARDQENRRVWKTPVMDVNGAVKVYASEEDAIVDARKKVLAS